MIGLEYIYHDGFILSLPGERAVVFDYWKDPRGNQRIKSLIESGATVYVVVSHHHKDHFVADILEWWELPGADVHYVISRDVYRHCRHRLDVSSSYRGVKVPGDRVNVLAPGERFEAGSIVFEAYGSTDIGNSYVVKDRDGNFTMLHAGDLNAWLWLEESTDAEVRDMMGRFEKILDQIREAHRELDLALFPVDSRIGREYWTGARRVLEEINVKVFVPMHFGLGESEEERERYRGDALRFGVYAPPGCRTLFCGLTAPGDSLGVQTRSKEDGPCSHSPDRGR